MADFCITVQLFGAVSSPSCTSFILRKTTDDNWFDFPPTAVQTVKENFYTDDFLKSMATEKEAALMVK